jgi:clan AA aspartic protease
MAVESGKITSEREPLLPVRLTDGVVIECLVDTGFSGALMLPRSVVRELAMPVVAKEVFATVGQRLFTANVCLTEVQWLGRPRMIRVIVSDGFDAIIGTEMFDGHRLIIDYAKNTVELTGESLSL